MGPGTNIYLITQGKQKGIQHMLPIHEMWPENKNRILT